ncbi:hypothetical protein AgCh_000325 [Apium graveolens]
MKCPYEHAVYTRRVGVGTLIVGVYVEDLIITGSSISHISVFKKQMFNEFDLSDMGKLSYYLGVEVKEEVGYIELKQEAYPKKVIENAGMSGCNPVKYPMEPRVQLTKDEGGNFVNATQFKSMIGGLRYLVHTRPDIAYSVGVVSRYMEKPTTLHLAAVKRILRYVEGTLNYGMIYRNGQGNYMLAGFCDRDLAGNVMTVRVPKRRLFISMRAWLHWYHRNRGVWRYLPVKPSSWLSRLQHAKEFG